MKKKVDIIVSCFNEEDNISPFYNEIIKYLNDDNYYYNIVFINDGSTDNTYDKIIEVASNQQFDDYSKLYYIRSTYTQPGRWHEIDKALKLF